MSLEIPREVLAAGMMAALDNGDRVGEFTRSDVMAAMRTAIEAWEAHREATVRAPQPRRCECHWCYPDDGHRMCVAGECDRCYPRQDGRIYSDNPAV